ncbi:short-chain dehydrogenase [Sulfolobales archaeon HS-7]|nr:short-chain dehydrogenase [Sulfolobales archaeon HS-7]
MIPGIKGKRVLVTAASRGIGYATAKRFLEEGATVVISSHDESKLNKAVQSLSNLGPVKGIKADLTSSEEVSSLVREAAERLGGLDVLAYITGSPKPGEMTNLSDQDWEDGFKLLIMSAVVAVREATKLMKRGGRIILSASMTLLMPLPRLDLSNVLRLSIAGIVKSASIELAQSGILVNGVLPGWTMTERIEQIIEERSIKEGRRREEIEREIVKDIPLGRYGKPEEIANAILFLASDLSTYITGALIPVDGGYTKCI